MPLQAPETLRPFHKGMWKQAKVELGLAPRRTSDRAVRSRQHALWARERADKVAKAPGRGGGKGRGGARVTLGGKAKKWAQEEG